MVRAVVDTDRAGVLLDAVEWAWWSEGDRGLTVRRIVSGASDPGPGLTSQTIYTYFGSLEAAVTAMMGRAVAGLGVVSDGVDPLLWRSYAVAFPARWLMTVRGCGPRGVAASGLVGVIDRLRQGLGGPVRFAELNGVIGAELYGQLSAAQVTEALTASSTAAHDLAL